MFTDPYEYPPGTPWWKEKRVALVVLVGALGLFVGAALARWLGG